TVQSYVSDGPDLATATWGPGGPVPTLGVSPTLANAGGATNSVLAGRRSLGVALRTVGTTDYVHVFVSAAYDGQVSSNGHIRAELGTTSISRAPTWDHPGSPTSASQWQGPPASGNPFPAAVNYASWGN